MTHEITRRKVLKGIAAGAAAWGGACVPQRVVAIMVGLARHATVGVERACAGAVDVARASLV